MTQEILIASATGKVASEIVQQLADKKIEFKAASSNPERAQKILGDMPTILLNYDQHDSFAPALSGIKRLFLVHPQDKPGRLADLKKFIDAAVDAGVAYVVFMSALGANEQPNDPMHLLEQHIAASGLAHTILRPNWFMQNFNTSDLRSINEKNEIVMPTGDHKLTFIDTRDIAAVAVACLTEEGHAGKAYTLMGGEALSYREAAAMISSVVSRPITHVSPPASALLDRMKEHNVPQEFIDFMAWLYRDIERGLTAQFSPDVAQILGRPPRAFDDYVHEYADVWRVS